MGMSLKNVEARAEVSKVEIGECGKTNHVSIPKLSRLLSAQPKDCEDFMLA